MSVVVECTNCGKKLKIKDPKPGKRLRCPGCEEPFVPQLPSAGKPSGGPAKKKRRPAPVEDELDDFSNDFADEEFDDDEGFDDDEPAAAPRRGRAAGGRKAAGAGQKKSKAPLFIGVGVLGLALVGGLVFMLTSGGGDDTPAVSGDADSAEEVVVEENAVEQAAAVGDDAVKDGGKKGGGKKGGGKKDAPEKQVEIAETALLSFPWLSADSEVVIKVDFKSLMAGPVGQLVQNPLLAQPLHEFHAKAGFGLENLESIVVGVADVSKVTEMGAAASPQNLMAVNVPTVAVLSVDANVVASKLAEAIPGGQSVTEGGITFLRMESGQQAELQPVIWVADENTIVMTDYSSLKEVVKRQATELSMSPTLLSGAADVKIAFMPKDADKVFRSEGAQAAALNVPTDGLMGDLVAFMEVVQPVISGFSIGLDLQDDITLSGTVLADNDDGATAVSAAMRKLIGALSDALESEDSGVSLPPMPASAQIGPVLETFATEAIGSGAQFSFTAAGAGQQLAMLGPAMVGPMVMQAQAEAQRIQNRDNLQNIATAMRNFLNVYQRFPNAASRNATDKKLLSWRVHLLPFLGYESLYERFALNEPWDSVHNKPLATQMPDIFQSKGVRLTPGMTLFQVPVGRKASFESAKGRALAAIADDPANTILILEVSPDRAVYWSQPDDFKISSANPMDGLGGVLPDGFRAALVDGSVTTIESSIDPVTLRAMYTVNGGESVNR